MDTLTIITIATGIVTNITSFLIGVLWGRKTAYKVVRAWQSDNNDEF